MSELLITKQQNVEFYIRRARDAWKRASELPFEEDYDKQDIIVLNLQRACEQVLDMANYIIRTEKLGWPKDSAESFSLLRKASIISAGLEKKLIGMVGFRNVVVHQYREIDYRIVAEVINKQADDLIEFASIIVAAAMPK